MKNSGYEPTFLSEEAQTFIAWTPKGVGNLPLRFRSTALLQYLIVAPSRAALKDQDLRRTVKYTTLCHGSGKSLCFVTWHIVMLVRGIARLW